MVDIKINKPTQILLIILAVALIIRLPGIFQAAYLDEDEYSLRYWCNCHPPLMPLSHQCVNDIFGDTFAVSKFYILLIGLANISLAFKVAEKIYGQKAAIITAIIISLWSYHVLASTLLDSDGSFLMLFYLAASWFFLKYMETNNLRYKIITGFVVGLALLTKYSGAFILPILCIYYLIQKKDIISTIKTFIPITLIGLFMLGLYPLFSLIFYPPFFTESLVHLGGVISASGLNLPLLAVQYLLFLVLFGPLLVALLLNSIPFLRRKDLLPLIWIGLIFFLYTFVNRDNYRPLERYFSILVAPVAMIAGNYLSGLRIKKKQVLIFFMVSAIFMSLFFMLNTRGGYMPLYPKEAFITKALSLDWDFYMPINGNSGPVGFYINFMVVALGFGLSMIFAVSALVAGLLKKKKLSASLLAISLGVAFAYNALFVAEYLFSPTAPSINKVTHEAIDYANEANLTTPIYVFRSSSFRRYLEDKYGSEVYDFNREYDEEKSAELKDKAGSAIIIDFPIINRESPLWKAVQFCTLIKSFEDKGQVIGYVYDCSG